MDQKFVLITGILSLDFMVVALEESVICILPILHCIMYCFFQMVKMVGILIFLLKLILVEGKELKMLHKGAIMHIDCIQDLVNSLCCYGVEISYNNMW